MNSLFPEVRGQEAVGLVDSFKSDLCKFSQGGSTTPADVLTVINTGHQH